MAAMYSDSITYTPYLPHLSYVTKPKRKATKLKTKLSSTPNPPLLSYLNVKVSYTTPPTQPATPALKSQPLPSISETCGIWAHPRLNYPSSKYIDYDVRRHPAYASAPDAKMGWANEPATIPPTNEMTIVCMVLPRPFVVRPSTKNYKYVTIGDVLVATHNAFRQAAKEHAADDTGVRGTPGSLFDPGRFEWAGLSEERFPGRWLLHVE